MKTLLILSWLLLGGWSYADSVTGPIMALEYASLPAYGAPDPGPGTCLAYPVDVMGNPIATGPAYFSFQGIVCPKSYIAGMTYLSIARIAEL